MQLIGYEVVDNAPTAKHFSDKRSPYHYGHTVYPGSTSYTIRLPSPFSHQLCQARFRDCTQRLLILIHSFLHTFLTSNREAHYNIPQQKASPHSSRIIPKSIHASCSSNGFQTSIIHHLSLCGIRLHHLQINLVHSRFDIITTQHP